MYFPLRLIFLVSVIAIGFAPAAFAAGCSVLRNPVPQSKGISQGFGPQRQGFHSGIDLPAPYGSPVTAAASGTVVYAGWYFQYGKMIDVKDGDTITRYAHLSVIDPAIRPDRPVTVGQRLGAIGATGHAHGPHLHFEV